MDVVRDSFRSSFGGWLWGTAAGLGTLVAGLAGIVLTVATAGDWGAWPLVLTGLSLLAVLARWLQVMSEHYQLTDERLIVRRGIVFKSIDEIELYRVKDVRMNFSLLNQVAGIGTISLASSDETTRTANLTLPHIPGAQARREELRRLVDAARRKRGVREIDMVGDHF
ncbi:MAG TPA: PH domain-containing protein [Croceibacterium sp.]|nr:PH domain-containing protein [Croceibacterium sp.]